MAPFRIIVLAHTLSSDENAFPTLVNVLEKGIEMVHQGWKRT